MRLIQSSFSGVPSVRGVLTIQAWCWKWLDTDDRNDDNRRMFTPRSPVHKGETADQNDCDGDQQYDHGLRVSLLWPIEGSPQVGKPSITGDPGHAQPGGARLGSLALGPPRI